MWVRKRIDITWSDITVGAVNCCIPRNRGAIRRQIEHMWSKSGDAIVCLSVRSGFDLLLCALRLPPGSEVLVSAANIADMTRILEHHRLVAVPVDVDVRSMSPTVEDLRRAITPATRAIMIAHLFGSRVPVEPMLQLAKEHNLLFFEDCAQAFDGAEYRGHAESDVVMFSFGPVKSATALGGALLQVRDPEVLERMRQQQDTYPVQRRWTYGSRLLKYAVMRWGGSSRWVFGATVRVCRLLGRDYDRIIGDAAHGFSGSSFFTRIRRQASTPVLAVLNRRLQKYDCKRLALHAARGRFLAGLLRHRVPCPASEVVPHTFWVFPVVVDDPRGVIAALARAGFDCTQGHNLCAGTAPADRPELDPVAARDVLAKMVYLPCYPEMTDDALEQMAQVLLRECDRSAATDSSGVAQVADVP